VISLAKKLSRQIIDNYFNLLWYYPREYHLRNYHSGLTNRLSVFEISGPIR